MKFLKNPENFFSRFIGRSVGFSIIFLSVSIAWGFGFHDVLEDGYPIVCVTPASSAMGGVWSMPSGGPASIFLNPAELSLVEGTPLHLSGGVISWKTIVHCQQGFDHHESGTIPGTVTGALKFGLGDNFSAGLGISHVAGFGFDGSNMVLIEEEQDIIRIYAADNLDSSGSLWEALGGVSCRITEWLLAGASAGLRFGSGDYELDHNVLNSSVGDYTETGKWSESDFCSHVGLLLPLEFGTAGFSYVTGSDRYKSRLAGGFSKSFRLLNNGILGVEFDVLSPDDKPETSGKFFCIVSGMMPNVTSIYSIGFQQANRSHRNGLCLSTGALWDLGNLNLDFAISWRSRSRSGTAFPDSLVHDIYDSGTYFNIGTTFDL